MYSSRVIQLLTVALSATTVTRAAYLDVELFGGVHHEGAVKRQTDILSVLTDSATSVSAAATSATTADEATTTTTTEDETTTAPTPTEDTTTTEETTAPTITTTAGQTTTADQSTTSEDPTTAETTPTSDVTSATDSTPTATSTTGDNSPTATTTRPSSRTTAASSTLSSYTSVVTEVTVVTSTDSSGQQTTFSSATTRTETGASLITSEPDSQNNNPGMEEGTKRIVIGVCVGVGGAIVLGVAGLMYWRLRNKKRNNEESEDLVSYGNGFGGPGTAEKSETATQPSARSPFQSTLESYHAPTQTNAASNF